MRVPESTKVDFSGIIHMSSVNWIICIVSTCFGIKYREGYVINYDMLSGTAQFQL